MLCLREKIPGEGFCLSLLRCAVYFSKEDYEEFDEEEDELKAWDEEENV